MWTVPVGVFGIATLVALALRQIAIRVLTAKLRKGGHGGLGLFLRDVRGPSLLWCFAAGLAIAIHNSQAPPAFDFWAQKGLVVFLITSIGLVAANLAVQAFAVYGERKSLRIAGLSRTLINLFIFSIVLLMILSEFNVRITPILTALGVGGLAVALALQDSLANFFAGIHILIEEPIRVGDFIHLSSQEEGTVRDIGWRTTRIETSSNSIIVIPNKNIVANILTNLSLPDARVTADVAILTSHDADPDRIAAIALEVAGQTDRVLEDPSPVVVFDPGVLPTHLQLKLVVHVATVFDRGPVQSKIRAELYRRFRAEGIEPPLVKCP